MEPFTATQALSVAGKLHDAVRALQEAVAATERNAAIMQDIARAVCISAPMLERLLSKAVLSNDMQIDKAFTVAINAVIDSMMDARDVVFSWLLKNPALRLLTAVDMEKALEAVQRSLVDNLDHIQRLQVDEVYHRVDHVDRKLDTVLADVAKLQHAVAGVQVGLESVNLAQQHISCEHSGIRVVVGQLQGLLQTRAGYSKEAVIAMAKKHRMAKHTRKQKANQAAKERASVSGQVLKGHSDRVMAVAWSPDGRTLATGSRDKTAVLWDGTTGQQLRVLKGHGKSVMAVAWSPDGRTLATGSWDNTAVLWDGSTGQQLRVLKGHSDFVNAVAWSPDGRTLATGSDDKTAVLWDGSTGQQLQVLKGHSEWVSAVAWSPDGRTLATGSHDKTAVLWDGSTWQQLQVLKGHSNWVRAVAWSPDGRTLATGSRDKTAVLWDDSTGQQLRVLKGHSDWVNAVAWSPDGRTLATGSFDDTAVLWDGSTGQQLRVLKGHSGTVSAVAWSPDGRTLATGSWDSTAVLWDVGVKR